MGSPFVLLSLPHYCITPLMFGIKESYLRGFVVCLFFILRLRACDIQCTLICHGDTEGGAKWPRSGREQWPHSACPHGGSRQEQTEAFKEG